MNKPIEEIVGESDLREILGKMKTEEDENKKQLMVRPATDLMNNNLQSVERLESVSTLRIPDKECYCLNDGRFIYKKDYEILQKIFRIEGIHRYNSDFEIKEKRLIGINLIRDLNHPKLDNDFNALRVIECLKNIKLNEFNFSSIPDIVYELSQLESLDLYQDRELERPFDELLNLSNLKNIGFHGCYIREIPGGISRLNKLETIEIQYNYISKLPSEILDLHNLKSLKITHSNLFKFFSYRNRETKFIVNELKRRGIKVKI